jgi:hypothetical protein
MKTEMEWTTIKYEGEKIQAMDFLDGIRVRFFPHLHPQDDPSIFVPGWRVEQQRGDADGPRLIRRKVTLPTYHIALVPEG